METVERARFRLLAGLAVLMAGNGLLLIVFGVRASKAGFGSTVTGAIIGGGYYGGFIAGSLVAPVLVRRFSTWKALVLLSVLCGLAAAVPPLFVNAPFWLFIRFLIGFSFAGIYVVVESWLNRTTPNHQRAWVLGAYLAVVMASFSVGSLAVPFVGTKGVRPFVVAAAMMFVGAIAMIELLEPPGGKPTKAASIPLKRLIQRAPLGTATAFLTAIANAGFVSSLAVWATRNDYSELRTSVFSMLGTSGPLLVLWPVTRWSDRSARAFVLFVVTIAAGTVAVIGAFGPVQGIVPLVGVFVLGGLTYTQYSLYGAETNDHLTADEMPSAGGLLMLITGVGAIIGSVGIGLVYRWVGNDAMFWVVAFSHFSVAVVILALRPARHAVASRGRRVAQSAASGAR